MEPELTKEEQHRVEHQLKDAFHLDLVGHQ
jgi:hypothetical protein